MIKNKIMQESQQQEQQEMLNQHFNKKGSLCQQYEAFFRKMGLYDNNVYFQKLKKIEQQED